MLHCMEITEAQYQRIACSLPRQRGNVKVDNLQLLNALLYVAEHGCKWRGFPKRFGPSVSSKQSCCPGNESSSSCRLPGTRITGKCCELPCPTWMPNFLAWARAC